MTPSRVGGMKKDKTVAFSRLEGRNPSKARETKPPTSREQRKRQAEQTREAPATDATSNDLKVDEMVSRAYEAYERNHRCDRCFLKWGEIYCHLEEGSTRCEMCRYNKRRCFWDGFSLSPRYYNGTPALTVIARQLTEMTNEERSAGKRLDDVAIVSMSGDVTTWETPESFVETQSAASAQPEAMDVGSYDRTVQHEARPNLRYEGHTYNDNESLDLAHRAAVVELRDLRRTIGTLERQAEDIRKITAQLDGSLEADEAPECLDLDCSRRSKSLVTTSGTRLCRTEAQRSTIGLHSTKIYTYECLTAEKYHLQGLNYQQDLYIAHRGDHPTEPHPEALVNAAKEAMHLVLERATPNYKVWLSANFPTYSVLYTRTGPPKRAPRQNSDGKGEAAKSGLTGTPPSLGPDGRPAKFGPPLKKFRLAEAAATPGRPGFAVSTMKRKAAELDEGHTGSSTSADQSCSNCIASAADTLCNVESGAAECRQCLDRGIKCDKTGHVLQSVDVDGSAKRARLEPEERSPGFDTGTASSPVKTASVLSTSDALGNSAITGVNDGAEDTQGDTITMRESESSGVAALEQSPSPPMTVERSVSQVQDAMDEQDMESADLTRELDGVEGLIVTDVMEGEPSTKTSIGTQTQSPSQFDVMSPVGSREIGGRRLDVYSGTRLYLAAVEELRSLEARIHVMRVQEKNLEDYLATIERQNTSTTLSEEPAGGASAPASVGTCLLRVSGRNRKEHRLITQLPDEDSYRVATGATIKMTPSTQSHPLHSQYSWFQQFGMRGISDDEYEEGSEVELRAQGRGTDANWMDDGSSIVGDADEGAYEKHPIDRDDNSVDDDESSSSTNTSEPYTAYVNTDEEAGGDSGDDVEDSEEVDELGSNQGDGFVEDPARIAQTDVQTVGIDVSPLARILRENTKVCECTFQGFPLAPKLRYFEKPVCPPAGSGGDDFRARAKSSMPPICDVPAGRDDETTLGPGLRREIGMQRMNVRANQSKRARGSSPAPPPPIKKLRHEHPYPKTHDAPPIASASREVITSKREAFTKRPGSVTGVSAKRRVVPPSYQPGMRSITRIPTDNIHGTEATVKRLIETHTGVLQLYQSLLNDTNAELTAAKENERRISEELRKCEELLATSPEHEMGLQKQWGEVDATRFGTPKIVAEITARGDVAHGRLVMAPRRITASSQTATSAPRPHVAHLRNVLKLLHLRGLQNRPRTDQVNCLRFLRDAVIQYGANENLYTGPQGSWKAKGDKENVSETIEGLSKILVTTKERVDPTVADWIANHWSNLMTPANPLPSVPRRFEFDQADIQSVTDLLAQATERAQKDSLPKAEAQPVATASGKLPTEDVTRRAVGMNKGASRPKGKGRADNTAGSREPIAEYARDRLRAGQKCDYCKSAVNVARPCVVLEGSAKCEECKKRRKGCFFDNRSLSGYVSKSAEHTSGTGTGDKDDAEHVPRTSASSVSSAARRSQSTAGTPEPKRGANALGKRRAQFDDDPAEALSDDASTKNKVPRTLLREVEVVIPYVDIDRDQYRSMEELMSEPGWNSSRERRYTPLDVAAEVPMNQAPQVDADKVDALRALVAQHREALVAAKDLVAKTEQTKAHLEEKVAGAQADRAQALAQLEALKSGQERSNVASVVGLAMSQWSSKFKRGVKKPRPGIVWTRIRLRPQASFRPRVAFYMSRAPSSSGDDDGALALIEAWFKVSEKQDFSIASMAMQVLEQLYDLLVVDSLRIMICLLTMCRQLEFGKRHGYTSGRMAEPPWITLRLNRLSKLVKGKRCHNDGRTWVKIHWPELLEGGDSRWPSSASWDASDAVAEVDDEMDGNQDGSEDGEYNGKFVSDVHGDGSDGSEEDDEENKMVEDGHESALPASQSRSTKRPAMRARSAKEDIRRDAERYRKIFMKSNYAVQCDRCRAATRAVRKCTIKKGNLTCSICRNTGNGCYFNGYSLNGTQSKAIPSKSTGMRDAALVERDGRGDRSEPRTSSTHTKPRQIPRATRSSGVASANSVDDGETTPTKIDPTGPAKIEPSKHEITGSKDDAPRRKQAKAEVARSVVGDGRRSVRSMASASAIVSDPGYGEEMHRVSSATHTELFVLGNVTFEDNTFPDGHFDVTKSHATTGMTRGDQVERVKKFIGLLETKQSQLTGEMDQLQKQHDWLSHQLAVNKLRQQELRQDGRPEPGPSPLEAEPGPRRPPRVASGIKFSSGGSRAGRIAQKPSTIKIISANGSTTGDVSQFVYEQPGRKWIP
ncbi:uncharacterized protein B0H18DRAFT_960563 [Fomitopsis serialis]|uniref:uncharacterized protein n=1 Tax=Fomitopsis serialis TaxID=139415 RepID=UPI002007307D|nr:uncharacterized protein B0H18DRAFT_960563 [Neoantrodia serialis]KAH9913196.1 hypothetical protein B0H18DRAFT_960563 [Neoantrodia serialis]